MIELNVVGFMGVIGSGKNYQQQKLVTEQGYVALDFKDELLDMCSDLVGYDVRKDYDWFKENIIGIRKPKEGSYNEVVTGEILSKVNEEIKLFPELMTGRRLLQRMGTEVMRKRDPDYWVKAWRRRAEELLKQHKNIAVADVRFQNEIEAIRSFGLQSFAPINTKIIFCDYYSERYCSTSTHPSEALAQQLKKDHLKDGDEVKLFRTFR